MIDPVESLRTDLADRYRIERELGRGGMATVYLAEDLKHHRPVAVKVLRPELTAALGPERFLQEIDVAAHLQHPHILPLFDSGRLDSGLLYYVMPYVEGESLRGRISREKQLPLDDALRLTVEVAGALDAAHARGIIHRDVKPENILLQGGHAVIADFGIARAVSAAGGDRLTETGIALGTPTYMSPEQSAGSEVDARADVYALGCVLYEMLTGSPPFTGATAQAILARHSIEAVPSVRTVRTSVPEAVERVVFRSLAKVPADRYATARQFADELSRAAAGRGSPPPPRRRKFQIGVLLLAVVTATVWWTARERSGGGGPEPAAGEGARPRVAIRPFANLSADTANEYLAQGVSEEIASRLSDFPELRIASRSSVQRLERADAGDLLDEARRSGFGHLVEGSVRRAGENIRVSVRLVGTADGSRRWSRSYDRAATDLLALQDEIALDVAEAVAGELVPRGALPTAGRSTNPAAHDQLLRGNYHMAQRNPRGLARAVEAYAEATRLDSSSGLAFAKLALVHVLFLDWGWTYEELPAESLLSRGWLAAERAVQLAPSLPEAWLVTGSLLRYRNPRTFEGVREALQRAVDLDPRDAEAYHEFGMHLRLVGRDSAAEIQFRRAVEIEPDRPMSLVHLGWIGMTQQRYDDARRWLDSAVAVNPGFFQAYAERAQLRLAVGDTGGARSDAETAMRLRPATDPMAGEDVLLALDLRSGDSAAARARISRLRPEAPATTDVGVHQAAGWAALLVAAGELREAMSFLERTRADPPHLRMHLVEPRFAPLRRESGFRGLLDRLRVREAG
ncbi:MAG TPA: protein kinase [Gemmatimonadales bacterium]|nr:protein kinase [Gemmatimonadales bacterium]